MNVPRTAVMVAALGAWGWAQDPPMQLGAPKKPAPDKPAVVEAAAKAEEPAQLQYGRVTAAEAGLRCFASSRSPVFEDKLRKGQVVQVGEKVGDYRRVVVPLGVTGYVHKKFTSEPGDGVVVAAATNVSFRYRPQGSEVPVLVMPKGTKLSFLGETDSWWKVLHPTAPAYVAEADLQIVEGENATLEAELRKLDLARRKIWTDAVLQRERAETARKELMALRAKLDGIEAAFGEVAAKPIKEQDLTAVTRDLVGLIPGIEKDTPEHRRAVALKARIERQGLLARAVHVVEEEVPTQDRTGEIVAPRVIDPMARFDAVGWLKRERSLRHGDHFYLYKGGRILHEIVCRSGRYDLWMFDGAELGIRGARSQSTPDRPSHLDALKIEVLKLPRSR